MTYNCVSWGASVLFSPNSHAIRGRKEPSGPIVEGRVIYIRRNGIIKLTIFARRASVSISTNNASFSLSLIPEAASQRDPSSLQPPQND